MALRNKKNANRLVFELLDRHSFSNDMSMQENIGGRWIKSSEGLDHDRLVRAELKASISISPSIKLGRFDIDDCALFCSIGLKPTTEITDLAEEEVYGGMLTVVISELSPTPTASTIEVQNLTQTGLNTAGYTGHDAHEISPLFPEIKVFSGVDISPEENFRVFFLLCLADISRPGSWIDEDLKYNLELIAELSPIAIPYRILCRALFDTDPSSVFLALYRSLEALYAYSHATKLISELSIKHSWGHVAQTLEETLSWRPREEPSLGALLRHAVSQDLFMMLDALGEKIPQNTDLISYSARKMYNLRNALVHYRAFHQSFDPDKVDWNRLCQATALMVLHIYESIVKT